MAIMAHPSSICFLLTSLSAGGAESIAVDCAIRLKKRGWQIRFITMVNNHAKPLATKLETARIELTTLDMNPGIPSPVATFRLARMLRKSPPEILHCHMVHANLLGRIIRLFAPLPVVISTAHSIDEGNRFLELAYRWTDVLCDITTHVSKVARDKYIEKRLSPPGKITFIPNGLDTALLKPDPKARQKMRKALELKEHFVWFAAGRIAAAKDYPTLIKAFVRLDFAKKPLLLIAGDGPQKSSLTKQITECGLNGKVRLLGNRDDIPQLMNAADAYVMSSAWEGLPMALLEASSTALPIIATDVGGNREVVIDGKTGHLVPPQDPKSLATAMNGMMALAEPALKALGKNGRINTTKKYDIEQVLNSWENLYHKLGSI